MARRLAPGFVVLCVLTGCSHGGGHPPTTDPPMSTSNGADIPFADCPTKLPTATGSTTDAQRAALAHSVVPITAAAVRVCEYAADHGLTAAGVVREPDLVTRLQRETNSLARGAPKPECRDVAGSRFFLTFSNGTTDIGIVEVGDCGFVTNGKIVATGPASWRRDLSRAGLTTVADRQVPLPTSPGPHPASGQFLRGTLAADDRCFWVEAPDHTRTDVLWPSDYTARAEPRRVIDFGFHVIGIVGQDVVLGGARVPVSTSILARVAPALRHCFPSAQCAGNACSVWVAA